MKNTNPASQLADKLESLDRAIWVKLPENIRKSVANYKRADQKEQQRIVNNLQKTIVKHDKELFRMKFGSVLEDALFDLRWENRTTTQNDLEVSLGIVQDEFERHFPIDKNELARRLESEKFFCTGQNWWASQIFVRKAIDLLRRIATKQEKARQGNENIELNPTETTHSIDFRSVRWFGTDYSFTPNQAAAVKILWQAWENRTPEVGGDTIATEIESDSRRARDIFKGHPAFGNMICQGKTKGTFRLVEPGK